MKLTKKIFITGLLTGLAAQASADVLRMGYASEPSTSDPHYSLHTPNASLVSHVFESLVISDGQSVIKPQLAQSWQQLDEHTWQFNLRKNVNFSNGAAFTTDDVIYSFCRNYSSKKGGRGAVASTVDLIDTVDTPDPHTLIIKTKVPQPDLDRLLRNLKVISASTGQFDNIYFDREADCGVEKYVTTSEIDEGNAIGTGPYTMASFNKGGTSLLERNPNYWGDMPDWSQVEIKTISNDGARIAGLLADDFDVIDGVSTKNLGVLKKRNAFDWTIIPSLRIIFLQLDVDRDQSPGVVGNGDENPLKDPRVRKAISLAINRKVIVDRILDGEGVAANQFAPTFLEGSLQEGDKVEFNPKKAKQLLAEAGYPNGFKLVFSATNNRYLYDSKVSQAITQYLRKVGIKVELNSVTKTVFFSKRRNKEYSMSMGGWSSGSGALALLKSFTATRDKEKGYGTGNYGGYSNPEFDKWLEKGLTTMDKDSRIQAQQKAAKIILNDLPLIPLHWQKYSWAYKNNLTTLGRSDEKTIAMEFRKKS